MNAILAARNARGRGVHTGLGALSRLQHSAAMCWLRAGSAEYGWLRAVITFRGNWVDLCLDDVADGIVHAESQNDESSSCDASNLLEPAAQPR